MKRLFRPIKILKTLHHRLSYCNFPGQVWQNQGKGRRFIARYHFELINGAYLKKAMKLCSNGVGFCSLVSII